MKPRACYVEGVGFFLFRHDKSGRVDKTLQSYINSDTAIPLYEAGGIELPETHYLQEFVVYSPGTGSFYHTVMSIPDNIWGKLPIIVLYSIKEK